MCLQRGHICEVVQEYMKGWFNIWFYYEYIGVWCGDIFSCIFGEVIINVHIVLQIVWWVYSIYCMSLHLCYIICNLTHLVSLLYICNITLYAMWWMIRMIYNVHDLHRYDISDNNRLGIIERIVSVHAKYRYVHVPIRIS